MRMRLSPRLLLRIANHAWEADFVNNYSSCLMKYFFILLDFKDAVREGNSETLATLHKVLLPYFKSSPGFNAYAIEMLISVIQNGFLV